MNSETIYQIIHSILADEATDEERRIFTEWLDASDANRAEYEKLKRLYQVTTHRSKNKTFNTEFAWQQVHKQTISKKKTFRLPVWTRYAAMVAIIVFTGMIYFSKQPASTIHEVNMEEFSQPTLLLENGEKIALTEESFSMQEKHVVIKNDAKNKLVYEPQEEEEEKITIQNNHLVIPKGKTYQLLLSDGTRIWLNSETEITYPTRFVGNKREITLIGEAFFEVAKDKEHPFIVKTDDMEVEALGTTFNVKAYEDDARIIATLFSGSVRVSAGRYNVILSPDEGAIWRRKSGKLAVRKLDNSNYAKMWRDNELVFSGETLEEIAVILNRMYNVQIVFKSDEIKKFRFTGVICNNSLDNIIELISLTSPITYKTVGDTIELNNR